MYIALVGCNHESGLKQVVDVMASNNKMALKMALKEITGALAELEEINPGPSELFGGLSVPDLERFLRAKVHLTKALWELAP